jgi:hypothetical protein
MADDLKALQDENKTLKDRIAELTSAKTRAEGDKAIAEAQRATLLAQLPPTETKALEPKATVDASAVGVIQLQAFKAIRDLAAQMARAIRDQFPQLCTILLYNAPDVLTLARYRTFEKESRLIARGYAGALPVAPGETAGAGGGAKSAAFASALFAPAVAVTAVKSVIDLVALFRTNVDIKGASVTFDDATLAAEVSRTLRSVFNTKPKSAHGADGAGHDEYPDSLEVIYSALVAPGLLGEGSDEESGLLNDLEALGRQRQESALEVAAFDNLDAAAKAASPDKERVASLKSLNARFDILMAGVVQTEDAASALSVTSFITLTDLLKGEHLARRMRPGKSAILFVKAVGGGESKVTQNLLRGAKIFQNGRAALTYLLFSDTGKLVLSDVLCANTEFVEIK